ncbi:MAG: hypothetical protein CM15mP65_23840 [Crocinitomicaceae bacterium]|nr:MAG: hypothetical protein CM15mP65_23840 [Crocinitomicaceae bacterium]
MTFFTVGLKDYLDKNSSKSNVNIIAKLREISEDAIEKHIELLSQE